MKGGNQEATDILFRNAIKSINSMENHPLDIQEHNHKKIWNLQSQDELCQLVKWCKSNGEKVPQETPNEIIINHTLSNMVIDDEDTLWVRLNDKYLLFSPDNFIMSTISTTHDMIIGGH